MLLAIVLGIGLWQTRHHPSGLAPDFALPQLGSEGLVTRQSLVGRPTMLVFWAPWCGVCKAEFSSVSWVRSLVGERARVLSVVASYRSVAEVESSVKEHGLDFPVLLADDATTERFKVEAFPSVFFLDADGRIKHSAAGYTTTVGLLWRLFSPI
jgi:thiol-disulfide isomerase/thioredoxin